MIFRLTAKLLKALGRPWPGHLVEAPASDDDWYGNLLWIEGRKCVLLTHAGTPFSVFVPDVGVADLRHPGRFLITHVAASLDSESLPPWTLGQLDPDAVRLAKTANRSVLGCMNDQAFIIEVETEHWGGLDQVDAATINHRLHRHIHLTMDGYPIDRAQAWLTIG